MGLNQQTKTPCGFCFVEYYSRDNAAACLKFVSGTYMCVYIYIYHMYADFVYIYLYIYVYLYIYLYYVYVIFVLLGTVVEIMLLPV
jgi:hypothetical protein